MKNSYKVIGLMSGTSLDGLDVCYANFTLNDGRWNFEIISSYSNDYNDEWRERLGSAIQLNELQLKDLDIAFGTYSAEVVKSFIDEFCIDEIDFVASHGHTVHHRPADSLTVQIGLGQRMANILKMPVVNDFRSLDVKLGGQGAPLVPIGDKLLFHEYDACLNLGGIANISFDKDGQRLAFDVSPANLPMNELMKQESEKAYDHDGETASSGEFSCDLLDRMNALDFYSETGPKSLGVEWLNEHFYPLIENRNDLTLADKLATIVEHESRQIANIINENNIQSVLITGGGAHNDYLIKRIRSKSNAELLIPDFEIVDYKEALVFAFLGVLRMRGEVNTLASVTGASRDSSGGQIWNP